MLNIMNRKAEMIDEAKSMYVPPVIKSIHKIFVKNKKKIVIAGGAVRDAVLGDRPKDYDLATNAKPDDVIKLLNKIGLKTSDGVVGKKFGIVIAKTTIGNIEIATFRKDIGNKRPNSVEFSDIEDDVRRRDLTINALYYDIALDKVVDLVGGIKDLKNKIIKSVVNPKLRFDEDPIRKLRAIRFAARINGKIDKDMADEIERDNDLSSLPSERIKVEFSAGISNSKKPSVYLALLKRFGMLPQVFKGLKINKTYINTKDFIIQVAWLLKDNSMDSVSRQLNDLKYTKNEVSRVMFLLGMLKFNNKDIMITKKLLNQLAMSSDTLSEWGKLTGNSKLIDRIVRFKLSVTSIEPGSKGLRGADIGAFIKNKEAKLFTKFEDLSECFYILDEDDRIRVNFPELEAGLDSILELEFGVQS